MVVVDEWPKPYGPYFYQLLFLSFVDRRHIVCFMEKIYELDFRDDGQSVLCPVEGGVNIDNLNLKGKWHHKIWCSDKPEITYFTPGIVAFSSRARDSVSDLVEGCGVWERIHGAGEYWGFRVNKIFPFIDESRSDIDYLSQGRPSYIYVPVSNGTSSDGSHIFRPFESNYQIFVTEKFKSLIERERFAGVSFALVASA